MLVLDMSLFYYGVRFMLLLRELRIVGTTTAATAITINMSDMGRVKKIEMSPRDMIIDCLKEFSSMCPKTRASTSGAGGYSSLFMA